MTEAISEALSPFLGEQAQGVENPPKAGAGGALMSVFLPDSRQRVSPDQAPWAAICRVHAKGAALTSKGTGFVVGASWILTAAHVLEGVGPTMTITAEFPGRPTFVCPHFLVNPHYPPARDPGFDVALLRTPQGAMAAMELVGLITLNAFDDHFLAGYRNAKAPAVVAGFPVDREPDLVAGNGPLDGFDAIRIGHFADTTREESGGPLLYMSATGAVAMGVHGHGDPLDRIPPQAPNLAARITPDMLNWIAAVKRMNGE